MRDGDYVYVDDEDTVTLDGTFSLADLEEIILRMKSKSAQHSVQADVESHTELESLVHPKVLTKL
jgi:hypothetical protein